METSVLSVDVQGASLHRTSGRVQIRGRAGELLQEIPTFKLHAIWLFGNVEITNAMLRLCLQCGPPVHLLTMRGSWRGSIGPEPGHRVVTRIRQYHMQSRSKSRLRIGKRIVKAKLDEQFEALRVWNRRRKGALIDCQEAFDAVRETLAPVEEYDQLLGVEGKAAGMYFEAFGRLFSHEHGFSGRNRRPPKDPVNALLSFGYTLLFSETLAAVGLTGLDPFLGFLHAPKSGRPSLALDLMEPFRRVVDELVLTRLNLLTFQSRDFEVRPNGGVFLKKESIPKFIRLFGDRLAEPLISNDPRSPSIRKLIRQSAFSFKEMIRGRVPLEKVQFGIKSLE